MLHSIGLGMGVKMVGWIHSNWGMGTEVEVVVCLFHSNCCELRVGGVQVFLGE